MSTITGRYAYEYAEAKMTKYVKTHKSRQFRRAYQRLSFCVNCLAWCDYSKGKRPTAENYAHAWEDVHAAFLGFGEPLLAGLVAQLWTHAVDRSEWKQTLEDAFHAAESYTESKTPRRYLEGVRKSAIRDPFDGQPYPEKTMPLWGAALDDYAMDNAGDVAGIVRTWQSICPEEDAEEGVEARQSKVRKGKPTLKLVVNNVKS